jgi:hypothetical protein
MQSLRTTSSALVAAVVAVTSAAYPVAAQQQESCTIVCAPTLSFNVAAVRSHVFGSPKVRNDTTGVVSELPSKTNLELQFFLAAPTAVQHLSAFVTATWLPNAKTAANPFTEYTASQLGDQVRANHVSLSMGALGDLVPKSLTHGVFALQAYVADLLSPAARPGDESAYTNKLDLGGVALLYPFTMLGATSAARKSGVYLYANLDYVASGLPRKGDDVPRDVRTFVTDAKPAALVLGAGIPIAPLFHSP